MTQYIDMETLRFQLYETHQVDNILASDRYKDYDKEALDMLLDAIKDLSDKELYPVFKEMDEKPAYYKDGKIFIHPQFESILKKVGEMGFVGASFDAKDGGLQLPASIFNAAYLIMEAANNHVTGYLGLTAGAANLILNFGSEELKSTYVPSMLEMKWGGTMCLTEPQAGSSLSDIVSTAKDNGDGTYKIEGQKIFISSGDHQYAENFVHLVLARIEGAPAGTKGISLFVVPKYMPTDNGLTYNHVATLGEFEKMGQRGYATTHLGFSDGGDSIGWLVGQENQGLGHMFQMMNEARIATGRMGVGIAAGAYYSSLQYARERPQGRRLMSEGHKNPEESQTLIINHPDVKRMLLLQKAIVEGSMSLITEASQYVDKTLIGSEEERAHYHALLELLTPVVKTYPAEKGRIAVDNGLQVLGGYGFTMDFDLQLYYRDIRIISIYEGTTGIQSLDLMGRKVSLQGGKVLESLAQEIMKTTTAIQTFEHLKPYAHELLMNLGMVQEVLAKLMPHAKKGDFERFLADATLFMDMFSTIIIGWQWLKMALTAQQALVTGNGTYSETFYESKVHTMKFYFKYEMSKTKGLAKTLMNDVDLTLTGVSQEYF